MFFKGTKTVTITANDTESGVAKIEYLLTDTVFDTESVVTSAWHDITVTKQFYLNEKTKQYTFESFVNSITFGLFFKESETVAIIGEDAGIGLDIVFTANPKPH